MQKQTVNLLHWIKLIILAIQTQQPTPVIGNKHYIITERLVKLKTTYIYTMRPQKILELEVLTGLAKVFRAKGYDGASLAELSAATGLKKASLYYRFPGGKQEMAAAVLEHIDNWVKSHVFDVLQDTEKPPRERLTNGLYKIKGLYDKGKEVCIFRALSMKSGLEFFEHQIANGMKAWINAFVEVGVALGLSPKQAYENAVQTLIEIQGAFG